MSKSPVSSRIHGPILAVAAVILVVVMPTLNAFGFIEDFTLNLWGKYLCYGIMAVAIDLLWGYTGLLCLGQALFFTLGGYMMGMHLMLMIGKLGQYKSDLPDFMVFLGHSKLPAFWAPFYSFPFTLLMVFLIPGLLAFVFGYLAFRSRIKGVYFSILTQALTYGAALLFFRNDMLMGGNNGFTDFRTLLGSDLRIASTQRILYICTAILLVGVVAACKWLTNSRFGLIQRAIRDSENRVLFSGYATANFKLFIFVASAMIAASAAGEGTAMTSTDQVRDGFVDRLFASALGTMDVFTVYLGDRLGLYRMLAEHGPRFARNAGRAIEVVGVSALHGMRRSLRCARARSPTSDT